MDFAKALMLLLTVVALTKTQETNITIENRLLEPIHRFTIIEYDLQFATNMFDGLEKFRWPASIVASPLRVFSYDLLQNAYR